MGEQPKRKMRERTEGGRSSKDYVLFRNYGMTLDDYALLLVIQDEKCAICGQRETVYDKRRGRLKLLAVDHDHVTGKVRGLLCSRCNTGLGWFREEVATMKAAVAYLEYHQRRLKALKAS